MARKIKRTPELIAAISEDNKKMTIQDICVKYNISKSTYYRIIKTINSCKAINVETNTPPSSSNNSLSKYTKIGRGSMFVCGLVSERHNIPTDTYIFSQYISASILFNFEEQYRICEKFILDNIFKNGQPIKDLLVYCTGIQSPLATLIKVAYDLKINLVLGHYSNKFNRYKYQLIWGNFAETVLTNSVVKFITYANEYSYYNCNSANANNMFIVSLLVNKGDGNKKDKKVFICKDKNDIYDLYFELIKRLKPLKRPFDIFAEEYIMDRVSGSYDKIEIIKPVKFNY